MQLFNATRMKAAYTMGLKPDGREVLVVVVKGTFDFPETNGREAPLGKVQADLVMADEFSGRPGFSAPLHESDFCPFKPRCDVLLNGFAHAPGGKPATKVQVGLRVGGMTKSFEVIGDRKWKVGLLGVAATDPVPFATMPVSYDRAFGGMDHSHDDPKKHVAFESNPAGRGFHVNHAPAALDGKPLPNTEESGLPVTKPDGSFRPMSFGPVGRGWRPRLQLAGTYDQNWLDHVFPFLPADFDDRHFQAAPEDQQVEYPKGGEDVVLVNLIPAGRFAFKLPAIEVPVTFYLMNRTEIENRAVVDTIVIEPERCRLTMVWRTSLVLKRNMFEVGQVAVGAMPRAWHRARDLGKTWYPSLKDFVDEKREEEADEMLERADS